ncbi:MAG: amidohydrolase family protein [Chloroflexota bacterium]
MTGGHGLDGCRGRPGRRAARRARWSRPARRLIEVMATGGMMTPGQRAGAPQLTVEEMAAAVEEAHKADKIVAAHVESDGAAGTRCSRAWTPWSTATV